jgi:putative membrane protein
MWYMMHWGSGWWMLLGGLWMVIFWGAIIGLIVWGISRLTGRGGHTGDTSPLDAAKKRYARGEITREEFEQIKKDLS